MAKKVLIVDDEPNIVAALDYLLRRSGYEVQAAPDGEAALRLGRLIAERGIRLEVCQRIRSHPEWSKIRIVILSAKGREADVSKGLSLGADAYITKPFSNAELVERIGALLAAEGAPGGA